MKIAHLGTRGFPGIAGGAEKALEAICHRLVARGHEVTVYGSHHMKCEGDFQGGTRLVRVPAIQSKHLETLSRTFLAVLRAARAGHDIVHFHSVGPSLLSWMTRPLPCKTFVTVHGLDGQRAKWSPLARRVLQLGATAAVRFPDRTIVVSKPLQRYYREKHGRQVIFIPNGVTLQDPLEPSLIQRRWGLSHRDYVLFAGRLVPEKGCHTLIEAFRRIDTTRRLVIAGDSWYSDTYVARLKRLAAGAPNVTFTGWADGNALRELYSNAYLYCLPSDIEGLSLSLLEAMSYGVCPLVSDIPENREVVEEAGVCFGVGDSEDLARRLGELLADAPRVESIGREARALVKERYDWDQLILDLERTYETALRE